MSNQNKTTTRKTLLITTMIASMGFVIVANSAEPELKKDETLESVTTVDADVTQNLESSKQSEEVLDTSSDELEATTTKDDTENEGEKAVETKEESKCGG